MNMTKTFFLLPAFALLMACEAGGTGVVGPDKSNDYGKDSKHLSELQAGIWVDPNGCDHWIIDDGYEGYMSPRVDKYGRPVCSGIAPPTVATGKFKRGSAVSDTY